MIKSRNKIQLLAITVGFMCGVSINTVKPAKPPSTRPTSLPTRIISAKDQQTNQRYSIFNGSIFIPLQQASQNTYALPDPAINIDLTAESISGSHSITTPVSLGSVVRDINIKNLTDNTVDQFCFLKISITTSRIALYTLVPRKQ